MRNHAFIFARGGSKGLPNKNIRKLGGKPLIQHSIEVAMQCSFIDKCFVSTDCEEISEIALSQGAILIKRPKELATDISPEWLSWRHAVDWVEKNYGRFDGFVSLPATSPLRNVSDVDAAVMAYQNDSSDVCISITESNRSPFFNMVKKNDKNFCELVNSPTQEVSRRQDSPKVYDITTVVYVTSPGFICKNYGLFSGDVSYIEVPRARAIDIDDIYDFKLAEILYKDKIS